MTNLDYYCIRIVQDRYCEARCQVCGDSFTTNFLAVHDNCGQPICEFCAWEKATSLAGLLYLSDVAGAYSQAEPPPHIVDELDQRRADPKRLKKELQEAHDSLDNYGHGAPATSPLTKLVAGQVKAALKSNNIETMKEAKRLFEESCFGLPVTDLDDAIPF